MGFDLCKSRWCWDGIIPGITDWNAAKAILLPLGATEHSDLMTDYIDLDVAHDADYYVQVSKLKLDQLVATVYLRAKVTSPSGWSNPISLGDALNLYGTPCGIGGLYPRGLELEFLEVGVGVTAAHEYVSPYDRVDGLGISDPNAEMNRCNTNRIHSYFVIPWRGLVSMKSYQFAYLASQ